MAAIAHQKDMESQQPSTRAAVKAREAGCLYGERGDGGAALGHLAFGRSGRGVPDIKFPIGKFPPTIRRGSEIFPHGIFLWTAA
jgi:hypothetical protein